MILTLQLNQLLWIDYLILILLAASGIRDCIKGFIESIFSLTAVIVSILLAALFYLPLSSLLQGIFDSFAVNAEYGVLLNVISFLIIVILSNFLINKIGKYIEKLVEDLYLSWLNRAAGFAVGLLKGILILGLINLLFVSINSDSINETLNSSVLIKYISYITNLIINLLPEELYNQIGQILESTIGI